MLYNNGGRGGEEDMTGWCPEEYPDKMHKTGTSRGRELTQ